MPIKLPAVLIIDHASHFLEQVLHIIRASVIGLFTPMFVRLGYGLTLKEGVIMTYGGLRGAVSLAMALMLDLDETVEADIRDLVVRTPAHISLDR